MWIQSEFSNRVSPEIPLFLFKLVWFELLSCKIEWILTKDSWILNFNYKWGILQNKGEYHGSITRNHRNEKAASDSISLSLRLHNLPFLLFVCISASCFLTLLTSVFAGSSRKSSQGWRSVAPTGSCDHPEPFTVMGQPVSPLPLDLRIGVRPTSTK